MPRTLNDIDQDIKVVEAHKDSLERTYQELKDTLDALHLERERIVAKTSDLERERAAAAKTAVGESLDCPTPGHKGVASYILPMGQDVCPGGMNPLDPATSPFGTKWLMGGSFVVLSKPDRTRPTRIVFSSGPPSDDWKIGATWDCRHDQTGARLGTYTVVGVVLYDDQGRVARVAGEVPNRRIMTAVFK